MKTASKLDYTEELRKAIWAKNFDSKTSDTSRPYCEIIITDFKKKTGEGIGWETIQDFLTGNRSTSKKTLNRLSAYFLENDRATFLDFKDWRDNQDSPPSTTSSGKKIYWLLATLAIILVVSVSLVSSYQTQESNFPEDLRMTTLDGETKTDSRVTSNFIPSEKAVKDILDSFQFDTLQKVNFTEASKVMQTFGFQEVQHYTGGAEPFLKSFFDNKCMMTIWIGTYGKRDTYGIRCNCNLTEIDFTPYYLEIEKT